MTDHDDLETTVDEPAGEPTPAATFRAREGDRELKLILTALRHVTRAANDRDRAALATVEGHVQPVVDAFMGWELARDARIAELEAALETERMDRYATTVERNDARAEIARLTSERDRAVALVREVAEALDVFVASDEFVSERLVEAMGACLEYAKGGAKHPTSPCPTCGQPRVLDSASDLGSGRPQGWVCKNEACGLYNQFVIDGTLPRITKGDQP